MIEWQVIEHRQAPSWQPSNSDQGASSPSPRPGVFQYVAAGLALVATGVLAVFAFSFVVLFVLPVLLVGGLVVGWRWRRMLRQHQALHRKGSTPFRHGFGSQTSRENEGAPPPGQGEVIDV